MKNSLLNFALISVLGGALAASCQTANEYDIVPGSESCEITLVAEPSATKTINQGSKTLWAAGDQITAIHVEKGGDEYYTEKLSFREGNSFGGRVDLATLGDINHWYVVYPYDEINVNPKEIHISVPFSVTQSGNSSTAHLAGSGFPLWGKSLNQPFSNTFNASMENALSVAKFNVTNNTEGGIVVKEVVFFASSPVSGDFVGDLTYDDFSWNPNGSTSNTITLEVEDAETLAAGESALFYAPVIPFHVEKGGSIKVKVTAENESGDDIDYYRVYTLENGTRFLPGTMKSINVGYDESQQTDPQPAVKQDQNLSFAESNVYITLDEATGTQAVQTVSGAMTNVSYSSSNASVATVSGTTITITGFGSTTITANAVANDAYNAGSASYTLHVQQSSSTGGSERTYTYQTSVSAGTYLLGGYESSGNNYSIALFPTVLTGSWNSSQGNVTNGQYIGQRDITSASTLTFTNDSEIFNAEVELISSGSGWKIKIKSTGEYLGVPTQDNRIVYTSSESSATAFSISGGSMGSSNMGISSGSYYFYHSGSAQGFSMRAYQVTNIRLYKLTSESSASGKQDQNLSFANRNVTQYVAATGGTLNVQSVYGAYTNVSYSSSNSSVATVSGTTITVRGFGSTTITATAAESSAYNSASASYTLTIEQVSGETGDPTYVRASALNVGATYLITSVDDTKLFKGSSDGSYVSISASSGVITDPSNSYSAYEFTVSQSGSKYCLIFNDGKYLLCDYSSSGNSTTGLTFESSKPSDSYLYSVTVSGSVFEFMTAQRNSTSTSEVLYFKPSSMSGSGTDRFKIGASGAGVGVHLFEKTSGGSGKQFQTLSFDDSTVTLPLDVASGNYQVQQVKNAKTSVSYSSSNQNVATVSGSILTVRGFGETTITATAVSSDTYYSASASYTLVVKRVSQEGVYNLENAAIEDYLDRAIAGYTASNHSSTSYVSTVLNTYGSVSASNRLDWPAPATVSWTQSSTGSNRTLSVYYDQAHTNEEVMAVVELSSNSADIYNLVPGKTYYWVLKNGSSTVASGSFETTGRRRMVGIGQRSDYGQNYSNNCRDLGGQVTTSGKTIKYGKLYRGTNMDSTTDAQKTYIKTKMNIGLDVDLRSSGGWGGSGNSLNNALGFSNDISVGDYNTYQGHTNEQYSGGSDLTTPSKMKVTLMRIFNAVDHGVNVYIHCMVGADRTGGTCLYIESLLGVAPERCDMDFEMTSFSCVGSRTRNSSSSEQYTAVYNAINNASGSTWQEKAINYCVNTLGVERDAIAQFQNNMLE